MSATFVAQLILAISIAIAVIKMWKAILFALAVGILTLAVVGVMTVVSAWHGG